MSTNTIDTQESTEAQASQPKRKQAAKRAKPAKKSLRTRKKSAGKSKADRANKKAEVIGLMKRAKGATLAEIIAATGWQPHTVRGLVSVLGSKGGEKIESSKSDTGERTYRIAKLQPPSLPTRRLSSFRGGVPACVGHIAQQVTSRTEDVTAAPKPSPERSRTAKDARNGPCSLAAAHSRLRVEGAGGNE